jgi:hypothetical protein
MRLIPVSLFASPKDRRLAEGLAATAEVQVFDDLLRKSYDHHCMTPTSFTESESQRNRIPVESDS